MGAHGEGLTQMPEMSKNKKSVNIYNYFRLLVDSNHNLMICSECFFTKKKKSF